MLRVFLTGGGVWKLEYFLATTSALGQPERLLIAAGEEPSPARWVIVQPCFIEACALFDGESNPRALVLLIVSRVKLCHRGIFTVWTLGEDVWCGFVWIEESRSSRCSSGLTLDILAS